ncbi:MAG: class I SAM-dependent methyltransferase [Deltaproteobacteria bacterium]|nr:class I SAM-dependent methyltransferase [Deltaproteobacteria bacterium]
MRGIENIPWLYDGMTAIMDLLGLRTWRRALVADVGGPVLEVGCGTGRNLPLYGCRARVVGLEPDEAALARARRRRPGTTLVLGSVEALPFRSRSFGTVVSSLVFCSVNDPAAGLREVRRVLKPEGELRMLEHVRDPRPRWGTLQDALQPIWTRVTGGCRPNRRTEMTVMAAGFLVTVDPRSNRVLRLFRGRIPPGPPSRRRA